MIKARRATFYFDGGCRPNPGLLRTAVVRGQHTWLRSDLGIGDNSDAEWLALLHAVQLAAEGRLRDVVFLGDSALVIAHASGRQRCRTERFIRYLTAYQGIAANFDRVVLRHVPRSKNRAGSALEKASAG